MRKLQCLTFLATLLTLTGCMLHSVRGSGNIINQSRTVSGIRAVELSGSGKLLLEQGGTESLTITTDDNLMDYLTSEVSGSTLTLGSKDLVNVRPSQSIVYKLSVKDLDAISVSGSGDVNASGVHTGALRIHVSGSGDITISGDAAEQEIRISGSANYQAENLKSKAASISISGSGKAVIAASDNLDVQVSGAGDIEYIGEPAVTQHVSGSGSVRKKS